MEAKLTNLARFIQNRDTQFVIPVYQRNYDWKEAQCLQLLRDIQEVATNANLASHFVGSIVHIQDSVYSTSSQLQLTIIDGQQRLTTISLLILCIAHKLMERGDEQNIKEGKRLLKNFIINEDYEEEKLKLRPVKKDDRALQYLIKKDFTISFPEYSRIIENYSLFKEQVKDDEIAMYQIGINKLNFVEVSLERGKDDPQRIFESLNSTGLDLSQADLIRNYVLMDIEPKEQYRIYDNYWAVVEQLTTEQESQQVKLSDFIRDYITIIERKIPPKGSVFQAFRNRYNFSNKSPLEKLIEIEKILTELKDYAKLYNKLININTETDKEIRAHLRYINHLEISVAYPFLLEVYRDFEEKRIDKETLISVLTLVQSFVWRRFICSLPTNALNKIFMTLYQNIKKDNYYRSLEISLVSKKGHQRFPKDAEIVSELKSKDFYNIKSKNRTYYLERLENTGKSVPLQIEGNVAVTTEHIFPQTPTPEWKKDLGEEFRAFNEKYKHTIANLTISGNNGELSNKSFIEKRDMPDVGYKDTGYWLNKYLANIDKWTEIELTKRLDIITERTLQIWAYPENIEENVNDGEEINIMDIEDITGRKLVHYVFRDTKYLQKHIAKMYASVLKILFENEPQRFLNDMQLMSTLKISTDKTQLRQAEQLSHSFYIETHSHAMGNIKKLRQVLQIFDLTEDLYLKFE